MNFLSLSKQMSLTCAVKAASIAAPLHSWPVFVRCYLTVEFDPMPCFLSLSKWMRKETIMRAACGSVYTCVWSCACVPEWEPLRYQAIAHLSMTAQLCQHSPSVFLSTLIHTIMNDELHWQKRPIYLNCSPALIFFCQYYLLIAFMRVKKI